MGRGGAPRETPPDPLDPLPSTPLSLFAYPLESNFSGVRYDPALVGQIQRDGVSMAPLGDQNLNSSGLERPAGDWLVLLDAAKACSTCPPNLSAHPVDFVVSVLYLWFSCTIVSIEAPFASWVTQALPPFKISGLLTG